jgi:hypothetical protein
MTSFSSGFACAWGDLDDTSVDSTGESRAEPELETCGERVTGRSDQTASKVATMKKRWSKR